MPKVLTRAEIRASLDVGGRLASEGEMPDPVGWVDLRARPDETVAAVLERLAKGRTPRRGQVFRWPKEKGGYRPMAWIDPLDQLAYRGAVGRLVSPIGASVDASAVLSARVKALPPRWELEGWGKAIAERRTRGAQMLDEHAVMGMMDVENFYPSVTRRALEETLGSLPLHQPTFEWVLGWLDDLAEVSGIRGLPTGHQPSQILANGLLVPGDDLLSGLGVPFLRYVDDTWMFLDHEDEFGAIREVYSRQLDTIDLRLHPLKSRCLDYLEAKNEIERFAISYFEEELRDPGPGGLAAGVELFEFALEDPTERKSELRRSLTCLAGHRDPRPLEILRSNRDLLRLGPRHWARYLGAMMANKPTRRVVGDDWLIDQVTLPVTKDDGYINLLFLEVASRVHLDKALGRRVFEVATNEGGWSAPIRVWATHVWGRSDAFNPNMAIEQVEERVTTPPGVPLR